jgi:CRISPR-associated endonuclease/helicase Cas3
LESEYRKGKRTTIDTNFINSPVISNLPDVLQLYREGKKILIVLNTVARAQNAFNILRRLMKQSNFPSSDIMLIHSRFTFFDRRILERRIFDYPKIVVATQVVEVSLDIDYDVLFTEACYLDSLVQRAGRINRRGNLGNNGEGVVRVFQPEGSLPYISRMLENSIRLLRDEAYTISSELDYVRLTNQFYDESWESSEEAEERFEEIWTQLRYINRANLSEENMRDLLRTRSGIITINSYSRTHRDEVFALDDKLNLTTDIEERAEIQRRIRMYSINVPIVSSVTFSNMRGHADNEYTVVNSDYDASLGLLINTDVI